MTISREHFELLRDEFGFHSSWAVWGDMGDRPKDGMDDLSIFGSEKLENTLRYLHTDFVIVALNISKAIEFPLSNFHGKNGEVYKARYAFRDTPLHGGYMTDVIKDFEEAKAQKMSIFLKKNKSFEQENVRIFEGELSKLKSKNLTLVALGQEVEGVLRRNFKDKYNIIRVPHYAYPRPKEVYREMVLQSLKKNGL
jgi:hypothetical protein